MKKSYFMGSTSPSGFKTKFIRQIQNPEYYTYILKGGPGTGKSTLMKKIADTCDDDNCELYYCSSDTSSLDAVVLTDKKIIVVDGTAPHVFDPEFPGVSQEIINLGAFWSMDSLNEHKKIIKYYFEENAKHHARARRYIQAAASLNSNICNIAANAINTEKLDAFIGRISDKLFSKKTTVVKASKEFKQLSAFTASGYTTREISKDYSIYILKDDYFAGSSYFLKSISEIALHHGADVLISECYMLNDTVYEHILLPQLSIAFITSNIFNKCRQDDNKTINFSRFYDKEILSQKKNHISFNIKASLEISGEAAAAIETALDIHNELERFYIEAVDFKKLDEFSDGLIKKITG